MLHVRCNIRIKSVTRPLIWPLIIRLSIFINKEYYTWQIVMENIITRIKYHKIREFKIVYTVALKKK